MAATILIVDDNTDSRELLKKLLEGEGYTILTGQNGYDGLNLTEAMSPDIIITDLSMPGLDGVQMIKMIRERPSCSRVPIIALTALGHRAESESLEAGADQALSKPVGVDSLIKTIEVLISPSD
jgi:CheY-like chemotaxis protein